MKATIQIDQKDYCVDFNRPLDISISLQAEKNNLTAWYLDQPIIEPVKDGDFIGKVSQGASVNFNNVAFNPHGHTTHTECVGHISEEFESINQHLKSFFFLCQVITITPIKRGEDHVMTRNQIEKLVHKNHTEALVIRTEPNSDEKKNKQYSHTNWPYLLEEAALYLREIGIQHLLIDLPSVDKEKDEGKLLAHKAFWNYPENPRYSATITELIFVPNTIEDGDYLLNLQIASFENDATPSKPILYKLEEK